MNLSRKQRKKGKKKEFKIPAAIRKKLMQSISDNQRDSDYVIPEYILSVSPEMYVGKDCPSLSISWTGSVTSSDYSWQCYGSCSSMTVKGYLFTVAFMPVMPTVPETEVCPEADTSSGTTGMEPPQAPETKVGQQTTISGRRYYDRLPIDNFCVSSDDLQKRESYPSDAVYEYVQEQLKLNEVRTGLNLVSPERTEHILHGDPKLKTVVAPSENGFVVRTVQDWSGGHSNPEAAQQYKKTQKPFFWTDERFMYEISDILISPETNWRPQGDGERYICVEERSGVPIKLVAEIPDSGQISCVTAYPAEPVLRIKK